MQPPPPAEVTVKLDLPTLVSHASWPVTVTIALLLAASTAVWIVGILKVLQVARLRSTTRAFERTTRAVRSADELFALVGKSRDCPGLRVLESIVMRDRSSSADRLRAAADRAIVDEKQRARMLMSVLGSIAAASPFVGLFGTVYGIMDAFVRIGAAKSASLPVVAPAIGEALVTTAIGLAAAIPAVVLYNMVDKQISDFISEIEAAAAEWVAILAAGVARPSSASQGFPAARAVSAHGL